jgi:hypothetical protein
MYKCNTGEHSRNAVEKQSVFRVLIVCFCSISYPTSKVHAPYFHLWPAWFDSIFPHYPIDGTTFGKKVIEPKLFILIFSTTLSQKFLILTRNERDIITHVQRSACKVATTLVRFS